MFSPYYEYRAQQPMPGQKNYGAIAQLGERYNGIVEVVGSIPSGSTSFYQGLSFNQLSPF
jgi:hypothetical protein